MGSLITLHYTDTNITEENSPQPEFSQIIDWGGGIMLEVPDSEKQSRRWVEEKIKSYDTIKLGIDARRTWYYVTRQFDAAPDF